MITPSTAPLETIPPSRDEVAEQPTEDSRTADPFDYSITWRDDPPSSIVITNVVQPPQPSSQPSPAPQPSYQPPEPRAYERDEPEVHGFVGLSLRGTTTNHNPSALAGGRVGFTFNDRFTIGGAFYSLTARYAGPIVDPNGRELGLRMAYGGLLLGWTLYKGRVVDVGLETVAAGGAACISRSKRSYGRWSCIEKVGLVSIEPALQIGFTVTDWVRLGVSGGYRFVTREAWRPPNDFTLSGPFVGLDVAFGGFRQGKR